MGCFPNILTPRYCENVQWGFWDFIAFSLISCFIIYFIFPTNEPCNYIIFYEISTYAKHNHYFTNLNWNFTSLFICVLRCTATLTSTCSTPCPATGSRRSTSGRRGLSSRPDNSTCPCSRSCLTSPTSATLTRVSW